MTLDLASIRHRYLAYRDAIRADATFGLPLWARGLAPGELLSRPLIFVDAENFSPAFDYIDRSTNIVGIVNDYRVGQLYGRHKIIGSKEISEIRRNNPNVIFVNSTFLQGTHRFFNRISAQNNIPTLSLLDFHRLLRLIDGIRVPIRSQALLECNDILSFFDAAVSDDYSRIEQGLHDEFSKITLYGLLLQRLTGDTGWHLDVCVHGHMKPFGMDSYIFNARFFDLTSDEIYVDAGAYRGDTIALFAESVGNCFKEIHAFEPDGENYSQMKKYVDVHFGADNRLHLYQRGLWDSPKALKMLASDSNGQNNISNHIELGQDGEDHATNGVMVDVTTLDQAIGDQNVSLLKLEVEGAELQALRGGRHVIRNMRPKIALSNYHRARDLIELFDEVQSFDAGYKIHLAQHTESLAAGVYYCVPHR